MWISDFSIRKPVVTTVVMLAMALFGGLALLLLETDEFPEVEPPVIAVAIAYPGASPSEVERELIDPLEEAFASISGVDEMSSTASDGYGVLIITFDYEKDLQEAAQDIRDKISEVRIDLPVEMEPPRISRFDPQSMPIVSLTLSSASYSPAELTRLADPEITGALEAIPGVADVRLLGGIERELTVEVRPDALRAAGLGIGDVVAGLQAGNLSVPVGQLEGERTEPTIRLRGRLVRPEEFAQITISSARGRVVRLGDVAEVRDGTEEPISVALFDGHPAVGIDVVKATDYSTTDVSERVNARVAEIQRTLPEGVELRVVRDAGVRVGRSVDNVERQLIEGAFLTVLVVFLFLRSWRSTVITGLALPVSVLASFMAVQAFGFTLNTMSLLGLSLAIGILVDDAIVVRENIVRHMEMGKDHVTAAREGTAEIGMAVAATTFSIVVVFVPIAYMGGVSEQWFAPFALTIACSVLVSLLVSFSLDPMLSAVWPDPSIGAAHTGPIQRVLGWFNDAIDRQTARYQRVIAWALRHRVVMVFIALASFVGALAMPAVGLIGSEFFPKQDRSEFSIQIETPPGSNLEYTVAKARTACRLAAEIPEVAYTYATIGGQGTGPDVAQVYVRLVPKAERTRSQDAIAQELRAEVRQIGGATAWLSTGGFGFYKTIQLRILGDDADVLNQLAQQVSHEVEQVPGAVDVGLSTKGRKPEIDVVIDRELAGTLGISVAQIAQALRPAFAGIDVGDWVDPTGETRDVRIRLAPEARTSVRDIESLPLTVRRPDGTTATLPLGQVADVRAGLGPALIEHFDGRPVVTVGANVEGRPLSAVMQDIEARLADFEMPPGYDRVQGGESQDQQEVFGRILVALGIALLLMYIVLVIQFESFLDPIPIMASLPLSLIGVMLALFVTGSTLNLMSMIGVILLMGIVAKNAILLIDFAKWAEGRGMDRKAAIVEAGGVRLRPILMTSFAVVAGMLPVAIGSGEGADFRAPLGRAVIGGVITSTFLTLLVIPTFYDILASMRSRLFSRRRAAKHEHAEHAEPAPVAEELPKEDVPQEDLPQEDLPEAS